LFNIGLVREQYSSVAGAETQQQPIDSLAPFLKWCLS
jgi:hypothetical protein